ncbi:MAG: hypothetical protein ACRCUQ_00820 [Alphaproteobacteria bacterium]
MLPVLKIHAFLIFFLCLVSGASAEMYGTYLNLSGYRVVLEELSDGNKQTTLGHGGKVETIRRIGERVNHRLTLYKENETDPYKILIITDQRQGCAKETLVDLFNVQSLVSLTDITPEKKQESDKKIQKNWSQNACISAHLLEFLGFYVEIGNEGVILKQGVSRLL